MIELGENRVNELAQHYSKTFDRYTFRDLFKELHPFLRLRSQNASMRATQYGLHIPSEDFESYYCQGLYQATFDYHKERGDFMPRLQSFIKVREADVYRSYQTKHEENGTKVVRYEKAQHASLDQEVKDEEGGATLAEIVLPKAPSSESVFFDNYNHEQTLGEIMKRNHKYGRVIYMLDYGFSKLELSAALGETSYNAKVRKIVQKSRSFAKTSIENSNDVG